MTNRSLHLSAAAFALVVVVSPPSALANESRRPITPRGAPLVSALRRNPRLAPNGPRPRPVNPEVEIPLTSQGTSTQFPEVRARGLEAGDSVVVSAQEPSGPVDRSLVQSIGRGRSVRETVARGRSSLGLALRYRPVEINTQNSVIRGLDSAPDSMGEIPVEHRRWERAGSNWTRPMGGGQGTRVDIVRDGRVIAVRRPNVDNRGHNAEPAGSWVTYENLYTTPVLELDRPDGAEGTEAVAFLRAAAAFPSRAHVTITHVPRAVRAGARIQPGATPTAGTTPPADAIVSVRANQYGSLRAALPHPQPGTTYRVDVRTSGYPTGSPTTFFFTLPRADDADAVVDPTGYHPARVEVPSR